jgi:hypothetical protein
VQELGDFSIQQKAMDADLSDRPKKRSVLGRLTVISSAWSYNQYKVRLAKAIR